ncbi:MAG: AAA family ATPase [Hyphomicrobiaceae bacterium]|nr:AAA family ATPase [Hyphomicrobiaceae bacterium]
MTELFILRNIATVNFYLYAQDFPIAARGNTVFLGANGSGKSVLLDAIQIVMTGMNRRYLDLNSRVSEGGRSTRTVREACLGLLDDGDGYEREACITYIALGFETADGSRCCTAGVCLEAKASVNEETVLGFFITEDVILRFADFVHPRADGFEEKAWHSFLDEQRRLGRAVHVFQRQNNRNFLRQLYAIINANARGTQLDPDRARAAMRQALSFDIQQIKSVTDFVKRYLLDEIPIDIETFQSRYMTWREMQKQIARVEAEIKAVETMRSLSERVLQDQFNVRFWTYAMHRAEYDRYGEVIARQRREIAGMQKDLDSTQSYLVSLADGIEHNQRLLQALEEQIDGTPSAKQLRLAEAQKERQDAIRRRGNIESKPIFDALSGLRDAVTNRTFPARTFPDVANFVQTQLAAHVISTYDASWPKSPSDIASTIGALPSLSAACARIEDHHKRAVAERARLSHECDEVERVLKRLRSGGTYMSPDTQDFLADMARMGVPAQSLSEVADIGPAFASWRGIIEAILGDWVDAVIVEPSHMDRAYRHFDDNYKATRAKLIQSENVSAQDQGPRPGTLAEAVVTANRYARAFLNVRLGRIVRARSADDIRKGDLAASEDGKYAHGRGIEYRRLQPVPRLGKSVRDQQIAQLTDREKALKLQLAAAKEDEARLHAILHALKQADAVLISNKADVLRICSEMAAADTESKRQAELIAELEADLPHGLKEEKSKVEAVLKSYRQERQDESKKERDLIDQIGQRRGGMNSNTELRTKAAAEVRSIMPMLERRKMQHDPSIGLERFVRRARASYLQEKAAREHPAHVRNHFDTLLKERKASQRSTETRLIAAVEDYVQANPDLHPGFAWSDIIDSEQTTVFDWLSVRHRHLSETVLRNFKVQVDNAVKALVETMVHDFLSRLRANIESVDRTKDDLNRALRGSVFMGEVYQIRQERDQDKETIRYLIDRLDIVAPKATALMQSNPDPNDPDQVKITELIDMLTLEASDDATHRRRLNELADYRNYFRFTIDICDPNNGNRKISDLEQRRGKASGGQKFVPFYICLGVAAASAYRNHLGGSKDAPPQSALLLMDEAFEKLDPDNIHKIIQFYQRLGLQLVMAAPKTHQALYQETFDTLISIVRVGRAIEATAQHFHPAAHQLLRSENPMHKVRSFFEERVRREREDAAE